MEDKKEKLNCDAPLDPERSREGRKKRRCLIATLLLLSPEGDGLSSLIQVNPPVQDVEHAMRVLGDIVFVSYQVFRVALEMKLVEEMHSLLRCKSTFRSAHQQE